MGYGDWVGRWVGYTGYYPPSRKDPPDSEAGPVSPCRGLEWVVRRVRPPGRPLTTPAGPGRVWDPPCQLLEQTPFPGL